MKLTIKNSAHEARAVPTVQGWAVLQAGEVRDVDVAAAPDDATLDRWNHSGLVIDGLPKPKLKSRKGKSKA